VMRGALAFLTVVGGAAGPDSGPMAGRWVDA
jgi:hypothetical protein